MAGTEMNVVGFEGLTWGGRDWTASALFSVTMFIVTIGEIE